MLANFFGKSNPANFVIIFLLFLGFFCVAFLSSFSIDSINSSILLKQASILGLFVLLFFFFNFILAKNKLTLYNSYGFLFFVLLFGIFSNTMLSSYEVLLNVILLIFLRRIYSLRSPKDIFKKIFDSGLWLGILFILEPFSALYGILIFIAILLFQQLNTRTLIIPFVGFIVPLFCYYAYCFWFNQIDQFEQLFLWYTDYNFQNYGSGAMFASIILIGLCTLISILFKTPKVFLISGSYRKYWLLILANLLVAILMIFFSKENTGVELMYAFFPIAIILTNWIEGIKKGFLKDLILGVFILLPIVLFII